MKPGVVLCKSVQQAVGKALAKVNVPLGIARGHRDRVRWRKPRRRLRPSLPSTLHTLGLAFRSPGQVGDYIRYLPEVAATGLGPSVLRKRGEVGFRTLRYAVY
jgi:hypothetical protein